MMVAISGRQRCAWYWTSVICWSRGRGSFPGSQREAARQLRIALTRHQTGRWRRTRCAAHAPLTFSSVVSPGLFGGLGTLIERPNPTLRERVFANGPKSFPLCVQQHNSPKKVCIYQFFTGGIGYWGSPREAQAGAGAYRWVVKRASATVCPRSFHPKIAPRSAPSSIREGPGSRTAPLSCRVSMAARLGFGGPRT